MIYSPDEWKQWMASTYKVCLDPMQTQGQLMQFTSKPGNGIPMSGQLVVFVPALHAFDGAGKPTLVHRQEFRIQVHLN